MAHSSSLPNSFSSLVNLYGDSSSKRMEMASAFRQLVQSEIEDIMNIVIDLGREKETWKQMAEMYKQGFDEMTDQMHRMKELLIATQAELMNESLHNKRNVHVDTSDQTKSKWLLQSDWVSTAFTRKHLDFAEKLLARRKYQGALAEVDNTLGQPVDIDVRLEGMLLKATILRESQSYEAALQQCDETLELCNRHASSRLDRSKVNFYRGLCLMQLERYFEARIALARVGSLQFYSKKAYNYVELCLKAQRDFEQSSARDAGDSEAAYQTFLDPMGIHRPADAIPADHLPDALAKEHSTDYYFGSGSSQPARTSQHTKGTSGETTISSLPTETDEKAEFSELRPKCDAETGLTTQPPRMGLTGKIGMM